MLIRAFLNSPNSAQNENTCKEPFETLARRKGHRIGAYYNEYSRPSNRSNLFQLLREKGLAIASQGRKANRLEKQALDELYRLVNEARPGDVLLLERARMLRELVGNDWDVFRARIKERKLRVVALDVESSWSMVSGESGMAIVAEQMTSVMMDMLEIQTPPDHKQQRQRQLEGIARAKSQGKYKGRPVDHKKHQRILDMLNAGNSWSEICQKTGVSRSTIARVAKP